MTQLTKDWPHGHQIVFKDITVPITIVCWDKPGNFPILVYLERKVGNYSEGSVFQASECGQGYGFIRIENVPAPKRTGWVNVWEIKGDTVSTTHETFDEAVDCVISDWKLLARLSFTEGEGISL